jgi:hypothetical protein
MACPAIYQPLPPDCSPQPQVYDWLWYSGPYDGFTREQRPDGFGSTWYFPDGRYDGQWRGGTWYGQGTVTEYSTWVNGTLYGQGTTVYPGDGYICWSFCTTVSCTMNGVYPGS